MTTPQDVRIPTNGEQLAAYVYRPQTISSNAPCIVMTRIVAWGSPFSGGHVLAVAADDPRIAAVISQAPFTDAVAALRAVPLKLLPGMTLAGLRDQFGAWRGRPPRLRPAIGDPGTVAA